MIEVSSTKAFTNLPCGHCQWFDLEPDGSPGECSSIHGYDRTVRVTFSGEVDEYGWIIPFGELKSVKAFIEYYFDHTTVIPADDVRIKKIPKSMTSEGGLLSKLRILPYGVSMEMSSLFVWEHVNQYIYQNTDGRCYVSKVESIEHERNSAFIEVDRNTAMHYASTHRVDSHLLLPKNHKWAFKSPKTVLNEINAHGW